MYGYQLMQIASFLAIATGILFENIETLALGGGTFCLSAIMFITEKTWNSNK